jgi:ParB/RepB/Spo0J family partition protein
MNMPLRERLAAKSKERIDNISASSKEMSELPKQWEKIHSLDCSRIDPNPFQYRIDFDEEKIQELLEGYKKVGQLQPIGVRVNGDRYQIIFGEHRWRAGILWNGHVDAIIRDVTDSQMADMCFAENNRRSDPSAYEDYLAICIQKRMEKTGKEIQDALQLRPQEYYKLMAFELFPEAIHELIRKNLKVIGKTEAEFLGSILKKEDCDVVKFERVTLEAMERFIVGNFTTRKEMLDFIGKQMRKKPADKAGPAKLPKKKEEVKTKATEILFEGKPVGTMEETSTALIFQVTKEDLPQDKYEELKALVDQFFQS